MEMRAIEENQARRNDERLRTRTHDTPWGSRADIQGCILSYRLTLGIAYCLHSWTLRWRGRLVGLSRPLAGEANGPGELVRLARI
jgi:hypothetical protein